MTPLIEMGNTYLWVDLASMCSIMNILNSACFPQLIFTQRISLQKSFTSNRLPTCILEKAGKSVDLGEGGKR